MEIFYSKKKQELKDKFYNFFVDNMKKNDFNSIGLCGGRSIISLLDVFEEKKHDFNKAHFFLVDERCEDLDSNNSNFKLLKDSFFDKMILKKLVSSSNLHPFIYNKDLESDSIYNYNIEFNSRFKDLDLAVFSSGEDGHIASIFPSRKLLFSKREGYQYEYNATKLPLKRITLTPKSILNSRAIILIFIGEAKRQSFINFTNTEVAINDCPVKLLQGHENLLIITDIEV